LSGIFTYLLSLERASQWNVLLIAIIEKLLGGHLSSIFTYPLSLERASQCNVLLIAIIE